MTKYEMIEDALSETDVCDLVYLWNHFCNEYGYDEDVIFDMYDFDEYCKTWSPSQIVSNLNDFNYNDGYFTDGIYGLKSFDSPDEIITFPDLINWIIDDDFGGCVAEIEDVLNSEEYENAA